MERLTHSRVAYALPSLTDAAFVMPLAFLFVRLDGARMLLSDADTGWHIRTGEWILQHGRIPRQDLFSYTRPGADWFAWSWLWDAAAGWLHQTGGMAPVVLASALIIALSSAWLFRLALRLSGNAVLSIAVAFIAAAASSIHWLARPHLLTVLFSVAALDCLDRARANPRWLAALPPLTLLWTQVHGGFLLAVLFATVFAVGEAGGALAGGGGSRTRARQYALAAAACLAASLVNPYGYQLHASIYACLAESHHFRYIEEFLPLDARHPMARLVELMILGGAAAAAWDIARKRFAWALLTLLWAHFALQSARHIPIYMLVAAPALARAAAEWLQRLERADAAAAIRRAASVVRTFGASACGAEYKRRVPLASAAAAGLVMLLLSGSAPPPKFRAQWDPGRYPAQAVDRWQTELTRLRVFTSDEWGDYLIYRLYPQGRVFVDGRSDFYGSEFGERYQQVLRVKHGWETHLDSFGVQALLLPTGSALAGAVRESARWRLVHQDDVAAVFRPAHGRTALSAAPRSGKTETSDRRITLSAPAPRPLNPVGIGTHTT